MRRALILGVGHHALYQRSRMGAHMPIGRVMYLVDPGTEGTLTPSYEEW